MIPVSWYEGIFGLYAHEGTHGRSRYACCGLLNDMFDSYECEHFSGFDAVPANAEGAVVVVHGGHLRHDVDKINQDIARLQWVIIIGIGDEETDFPYARLSHRNMKLWMQAPIAGKSSADRYLIFGYPCDMHEHLVPSTGRPLDWFFAGQNSHVRREECLRTLRTLSGGKLLETQQFYSGMPHDEYFHTLSQAKVIPCPSGPVCPDTFRMAEALEAGSIPVIDQRPGWLDNYPRGFWNVVFPQGFPFPLVEDWAQFPQVLSDLLANYLAKSAECSAWWTEYKRNYFDWLRQDLKALGATL